MPDAPNLEPAVRAVDGGVDLAVYCQPKAVRTAVIGSHAGMVKIKVREAPVDGKANEALLVLLAGVLGRPRGTLHLMTGEQSRMKRVRVDGARPEEVLAALRSAVERARPPDSV
jgi:uncharacterized protein (TIGR00251 family)